MHNLKSTFILITVAVLFFAEATSAHCDSMEGPVVKASKKALESGNINYVLIWIQPKDEPVIKELFERVNKVRSLGQEAKELAEMYFFETVVRVHRMGEGEPYTGIKPAGYHPAEGIEAADAAIENKSLSKVLVHIPKEEQKAVKSLFTDLQLKSGYDVNDLIAGRQYVAAYVLFIHHVERLFEGGEQTTNENQNHIN